MSAESPIYVSSTESSPSSTPVTSREASPVVTERPPNPAPLEPNPLPFQKEIDCWIASINPHPTSEEVRHFIHDVRLLSQYSLTEDRQRMEDWHRERLEVRAPCLSLVL